MPPSFLDTFRTLAAFSPARTSLAGAPWEPYVDWAVAQGLAPLAAYNVEYRLAGADAPTWVRDRLLSVYQGSVNDNVMKLVAFKRAVDSLQGRKVILLGGASFAEALYPHVGFRPVLEIRVLTRAEDVAPFANFLGSTDFRPAFALASEFPGAAKVLSDGHTPVALYASLLGKKFAAQEEEMIARAIPMRVYGPSMFRLELEDALLVASLEQAQAGYEVPFLTFIDVRELLLGAPAVGGAYSRPCRPRMLRERAREWRMERSLYVTLAVTARLFPEVQKLTEEALPPLRPATRRLLETTVVAPLADIGKQHALRGVSRLRRLLTAR